MNTKTYWLLLIEKVVRAFAAGALAVLGTGKLPGVTGGDLLHGVPWMPMLTGGVIGALVSLLSSLSSEAIPNTLPTSFVPARMMQGTRLVRSRVAALVPVVHPSKDAAHTHVAVAVKAATDIKDHAGKVQATPKPPGNPKAQN